MVENKTNGARLILAQTIYGEARGEGVAGMEAVAAVVMNRVKAGGWWGATVIDVCQKPWQFSAWNSNDPNSALIAAKRPGEGDSVFDQAFEIAGRAVAGQLSDRTGGATHYYNPAVVSPSWATGAEQTAALGNHLFFRNVG